MSNRNKTISAHAASTQRAVAVLAEHVNWRKWSPVRQIEYLFSVESAPDFYARFARTSQLGELYAHCVEGRSVVERQHCRAFLVALAGQRSALLTRPDLAAWLGVLGTRYPNRLRELAGWVPQRKNVHFQLESLVRHLFDRYGDVPAWVVGAWTATRTANLGLDLGALTVHLGRGQSLRSFAGLPVPLTKRLEHEMRQAPAACTFLEAYRYAQLAVRDALDWFGVVLESRLGREAVGPDDGFWLGVVDFFRAAPMVDPRQFGPVCDWIHQKRSVGIGPEPPQPGFSLRGRSMASVVAQTDAWHRSLAQLRRHAGSSWPLDTAWEGLPVPGFTGGDEGRVRIAQLTTFGQLVEEGRTLQHCVASYMDSCRRGRCGIFSLAFDGRPVVTLEVSPERVVVQARGRHNRAMAADERFWVNRWLGEARLVLSKHV
ncbi:PcfJ domain-containing protein [Hymenobacter sp.]|uniref:PcfJ domain-containing protein n=1 Tax=Hymenobacter sp. TaxID=1898978 RepID=UPI00286A88C8|nr:PcfJ domain-containing protein [Hymenobacter sp.]